MGGLHHWVSKIPQGTGFPNDLHLWFSRGGPRAERPLAFCLVWEEEGLGAQLHLK